MWKTLLIIAIVVGIDPCVARLFPNVSYLSRAQMDGGNIVMWYSDNIRIHAPSDPVWQGPERGEISSRIPNRYHHR